MSADCPKRWTGTIAFVLAVALRAASPASRLKQ